MCEYNSYKYLPDIEKGNYHTYKRDGDGSYTRGWKLRGRRQCRGSSCLGEATLEAQGEEISSRGYWLALGYRQICWQTHTANSKHSSQGQGPLLPQRAFKVYCKDQGTNTPSCDTRHRDLPFPAPATGTPSPQSAAQGSAAILPVGKHTFYFIHLYPLYVYLYIYM